MRSLSLALLLLACKQETRVTNAEIASAYAIELAACRDGAKTFDEYQRCACKVDLKYGTKFDAGCGP